MKKQYASPVMHRAPHIGPLANDEIARLPDDDLERYMMENGYKESSRRYRANSSYVLREIAGEAVLIPTGDLPGNQLIMLNDSGAFLWKALQSPKTMEDVVSMARECYEDPDGMLEMHIKAFITEKMSIGQIWEVE